jgi:TetR/AcrR family transcriptional regulator, regulator of autoinduction and epiphytic fitness
MTPSRTPAVGNPRSTTRRRTSATANGSVRATTSLGRGSAVRASSRNGSRTGSAATGRVRGETPKARGERTRQRVAEALISLLEEGGATPTAKSVASRAGVSVRLVFHHFDDMESLYRMVMAVQARRHWSTVREVRADLPLGVRIDRTVAQRAKLFDAIGPVRRAGVALAGRRADIAEAIAETDGLLRAWEQSTFALELRGAGRERRDLLDAIDAAASWEAWERLRHGQGLSVSASRRVMARTLTGLLEG